MEIEIENLTNQNNYLLDENKRLKELHQTYQIEFANYEEQILQYEALLTEKEFAQEIPQTITVADPKLLNDYSELKLEHEKLLQYLQAEQAKVTKFETTTFKHKSQIEKLIEQIKEMESYKSSQVEKTKNSFSKQDQLAKQIKTLENDKKTLSELLSQSHAKCSKVEFELRRSSWKEQEVTQEEWKLEKELKFMKAEIDRLKTENQFLRDQKTQKISEFVPENDQKSFAGQMRANSTTIKRLMQ